jgi:hypothetical protein
LDRLQGVRLGFAAPFARGFVCVFARRCAPHLREIAAKAIAAPIASSRICRHLYASSSSGHEVNLATSIPRAISPPPVSTGVPTVALASALQRFTDSTSPSALGATTIASALARQRPVAGRPRTEGRA